MELTEQDKRRIESAAAELVRNLPNRSAKYVALESGEAMVRVQLSAHDSRTGVPIEGTVA